MKMVSTSCSMLTILAAGHILVQAHQMVVMPRSGLVLPNAPRTPDAEAHRGKLYRDDEDDNVESEQEEEGHIEMIQVDDKSKATKVSGSSLIGLWWPIALVAAPSVVLIIVRVFTRCFCMLSRKEGDQGQGVCELTLEAVAPSVYFAPMLCTVFVAAALRAQGTSSGAAAQQSMVRQAADANAKLSSTASSELAIQQVLMRMVGHAQLAAGPILSEPTEWAINICAIAFVLQACIRVVYEWIAVRATVDRRTPQQGPPPGRSWIKFYHFVATVTYASLVFLIGYLLMGDPEPLGAAISAVLLLATLYFGCYIALHLITFISQSQFGIALIKLACLNMNFAPMLAALFLALKIAADNAPEASVPRSPARAMSICTGAVLVMTFMSVLPPICLGADLKQGPKGEQDLVLRKGSCVFVCSAVRWLGTAFLYVGVAEVVNALWATNGPPQHWAKIVCIMTVTYFSVYVALWLALTMRLFAPSGLKGTIHLLQILKELTSVCPMLVALMLGRWIAVISSSTPALK